MKKKSIILSILICFCLLCVSAIYVGAIFMHQNKSAQAVSAQVEDDFDDFERGLIEENEKAAQEKSLFSSRSVEDEGKFKLKKLIVSGKLKGDYGARRVLTYKDLNYLFFDNATQTELAYNQLKAEGYVVMVDQELSASGYADNTYSYTSYRSWGARAMDVGGYRDYLTTNGTSNQVVVVVIDTGVNVNHVMLKDRLLRDGSNKVVGDAFVTTTNSSYTYAFEDDNGHGSHVAGTIAELTPSNVKILPIKVLGADGSGNFMNVFTAAQKVADKYTSTYNIASVNISLGGRVTDQSTIDYIDTFFAKLIEKNVLPVVAASNDQLDAKDYSPANCANVVTVSALKEDGTGNYVFDHGYSNFGSHIDISAPGSSILSANYMFDSSYSRKSGTSMATPHVAAAVALLSCDNKYWSGSTRTYTAAALKEELLSTTIDLGQPGWDKYYGNGMVNFKFFQTPKEDALSFYKDSIEIDTSSYTQFDSTFTLRVNAIDPNYKIYYTTDRTIPSSSDTLYTSPLTISNSTYLYCIGYKVVGGEIKAYTPYYAVDLFNPNDNISTFLKTSGTSIKAYYGHFQDVTIPSSYTRIGLRAFSDNKELTNINLSNVTYVDRYGFSGCSNLKSVTHSGVQTLDCFAFENCTSLTDINLNSVITLGEKDEYGDITGNVFNGCTALKTAHLNNVTTMGNAIFANSGVTAVAIGNNFNTYDQEAIQSSITIYGYSGSVAQSYASAYSNTFVALTDLAISRNLPSSLNADVGDVVSISIQTTGGFDPSYTWYEGSLSSGRVIEGQTSSSLTVNTDEVGTKSYYVVVNNWNDTSLTSSACQVDVVGQNHTLTLDLNYSGSTPIVNEYAGDSTLNLPVPEREGYKFTGWYTDAETLNKFTSTTMPRADLTLYAGWEVKTFTITVEVSGNGSVSSPTTTIEYGQSKIFTFTPDENFFVFSIYVDGTPLSPTGLQEAIERGYIFSNVKENHTLKVTFKGLPFTITYLLRDSTENVFDDQQIEYEYASIVTPLEAPLWTGHTFRYWQDESGNEYHFSTMPARSFSLKAIYQINTYTISTSISPTSVASITPSGQVEYGQDFNVKIALNKGYQVSNLYIDGVLQTQDIVSLFTSESGYTFTAVERNHTVEAEVQIGTYYLILKLADSTGGALSDNQIGYQYGQLVEAPQTPQWTGHDFVQWRKDSLDGQAFNFTGFTMPDYDIELYAYFTSQLYTITVTVQGEGGSISPSGTFNKAYGESVDFVLTLNEGYTLSSFKVDDIAMTPSQLGNIISNGYTLSNITASHQIDAAFSPISYKITYLLKAYTDGRFNDHVDHVPFNTTISVYNAPQWTGYNFIGWHYLDSDEIFTPIKMPANDITLYAEYAIKTFNLTASYNEGGEITPANTITVEYAQNQTYEITADYGHHIASVIIDGTEIKKSQNRFEYQFSHTFTNITSDHTISVVFEINKYKIILDIGEGGKAKIENEYVEFGSDALVTIINDKNRIIDTVKVNGQETKAVDNKILIENVTNETIVEVTFKIESFWRTEMGKIVIGSLIAIATLTVCFGGLYGLHMKRKSKKLNQLDEM